MRFTASVSVPSKSSLSHFHFLIKSQIETRNPKSSLVFLRQLLQSYLKPNDLTFSLLLKSAASSSSSSSLANATVEANQIQTHLVKSGLDQFVYANTALIDLYMKLVCIESACKVFDCMRGRDVVSWNVLVSGYSRNGYSFDALEVFIQMLREGFCPCHTTLVGLVPACGWSDMLFQGKSIHGLGIKSGLDLDSRVQNALTSMYAKSGNLEGAELLFEEIVEKSIVSWNTMVGAYNQNGCFHEAMLVFKRMIEESVEVNPITIMSLQSANTIPELIHCYTLKLGLVNDVSAVTSLICAYAKCGSTKQAEQLYWFMPQENLVSLTAIVSSYAETGKMSMVAVCFARMQQMDMKLDSVAMVSIFHGIRDPTYFNFGLSFHGYALKTGLDIYTLVANGLISMYAKFNDLEAVFSLFSVMREKPVISWNSVISGCVQAGRESDALQVFYQMKMYGHNPDAITVASLLSTCSQLGNLQFGEKLHSYILRSNLGIEEDFVGTALVDMYTNCGSIVHAERVFKSIQKPCLATWNTMLSGYSWYGYEHKALSCYSEMREQGLHPDDITFLGILAACTHAGLVDEGRRYFQVMTQEFGIKPSLQHCACVVGLLGRAGLFEEAVTFIRKMETEPDSAVWGALLSACCIHQEVKLGECLAKKLYLLDQRNGGLYVIMSNLYAVTKRWDDVVRVREMMRDTGGDGCSGVSQIEVNSSFILD